MTFNVSPNVLEIMSAGQLQNTDSVFNLHRHRYDVNLFLPFISAISLDPDQGHIAGYI
jgi:hypothetical protein